MKQYITYTTSEDDQGREVLQVLKEHFSFSSKKIKNVKFAQDGLLLDGQRVGVRTKLSKGQRLQILMDDPCNRTSKVYPVNMELDIVFEDEYLLVLNKPAGVVCHPSMGHYFDSLENGVVYYLGQKNENTMVHLCGRLDKDTSGLVVFAKNGAAQYALKDGLFKTYLALCKGVVEQDHLTITTHMKEVRSEMGILKMVQDPDGLSAETQVSVLERFKDYSFVEVRISTGRMHQIRFHLSSIGHPLLGDSLYGESTDLIGRSALHAGELDFIHPFTGKALKLTAKLPEDMKRITNRGLNF